MACPDLNEPEFATRTVSRMIEQPIDVSLEGIWCETAELLGFAAR